MYIQSTVMYIIKMICFKKVCILMYVCINQISNHNITYYCIIIHKSIWNTKKTKCFICYCNSSLFVRGDETIYLGHIAWRPPSTGSDAPVMYDESSEARKAIALATSSGCPGRPSACVSLDRSKNWRTKQENFDSIYISDT